MEARQDRLELFRALEVQDIEERIQHIPVSGSSGYTTPPIG